MSETAWERYKKERSQKLKNGAKVNPIDLLDKNNYTTEEIANNRMQICQECPSLIKTTKQCKECGCIMPLKTKLSRAVCPLEKW